MKTIALDRAVLAVALATILGCGPGGDDVIEYQGQAIKLSRSYSDYDDYKNDPGNLDPSEIARVQKLLIEAPIARSFRSREEISRAVFEIKFPGYGLFASSHDGELPGTTLLLESIEIPGTDKNRLLLFRLGSGKYELLDDFVSQPDQLIVRVREDGEKLTYFDPEGQPVLVREAWKKPE